MPKTSSLQSLQRHQRDFSQSSNLSGRYVGDRWVSYNGAYKQYYLDGKLRDGSSDRAVSENKKITVTARPVPVPVMSSRQWLKQNAPSANIKIVNRRSNYGLD